MGKCPLINSNCTQCLYLSPFHQPLPPGPDPIGEKNAPGDDEPLINSNCTQCLSLSPFHQHIYIIVGGCNGFYGNELIVGKYQLWWFHKLWEAFILIVGGFKCHIPPIAMLHLPLLSLDGSVEGNWPVWCVGSKELLIICPKKRARKPENTPLYW